MHAIQINFIIIIYYYYYLVVKGSSMSGEFDIWKNAIQKVHYSQMYPPSRGIWWPRVVLCKVSLTFSGNGKAIEKAAYSQMYPPVEAPSGQEQYYIRSA